MSIKGLGNPLAFYNDFYAESGLKSQGNPNSTYFYRTGGSGDGAPIRQPGSFTITGGTTTSEGIESGGYTYVVFTSPGIATVTGSGDVDYLVIAGGGGGGTGTGGGGGAGGVRSGTITLSSPQNIIVGTGATAKAHGNAALNGAPSQIGSLVFATGGGGGASGSPVPNPVNDAQPGGSGGGGMSHPLGSSPDGAPTVASPDGISPTVQGFPGGLTSVSGGGGGGGSGGAGGAYTPAPTTGIGGTANPYPNFPGPVISPEIPAPVRPTWTPVVGPTGRYGGGGGGTYGAPPYGWAGSDGGGTGGNGTATSGVDFTGSGGGANWGYSAPLVAGGGGSGLVILRYIKTSGTGGDPYPTPPFSPFNFSLLLVAGGGGGGGSVAGGGGAGGILYATSLTMDATGTYSITVGPGGNGGATTVKGTSGSDTTFGSPGTAYLTAVGGGGGASSAPSAGAAADDGGSGGGGSSWPDSGPHAAGAANQPNTWSGPSPMNSGATITPYANAGGSGASAGGGGGGAGAVGSNGSGSGGAGGAGQLFPIVAGASFPMTPGYYGGGGGGGAPGTVGSGGAGGGGAGATGENNGTDGTANSGGGGGGGFNYSGGSGGAGGSGVAFVVVPDPAVPYITTSAPGVAAGDGSSNTVYIFTSPGTITISSL